jgi:hypothetical protein
VELCDIAVCGLLILYEGGAFDAATFRIEPEAWDHEDCDVCGGRIPPMTLCHVTERGRYISLCEGCYQSHVASKSKQDTKQMPNQ